MADGSTQSIERVAHSDRLSVQSGSRPNAYTEEIADRICELVATKVEGLRAICDSHKELPYRRTIQNWLAENAEFASRYARAREHRAELLVDESLEISDDTAGDLVRDASGELLKDLDGKPIANHAAIARARLRVDTRKWIASKLAPKTYGDKTSLEVSGSLTLEALVLASVPSEPRNVTPPIGQAAPASDIDDLL